MAILFNGTTSKLEHTTASGFDVATMSLIVWSYATGIGEGNFGRIFVTPEGGGSHTFQHRDSANVLGFSYGFSTSGGEWTFPATDNQWNAVSVTYDRSSTSNDPTARVNFSDVTVSEFEPPVGTAVSPATGYCVGNRSNGQRTWDGRLAHFQFFNVVLTTAEQDMALRRPGSVRRGLVLWLPMWNATSVEDLSGSVQNGSATALANADSPPCQTVFFGFHGWYGSTTTVAAFDPTLMAVVQHQWGGMIGRQYI